MDRINVDRGALKTDEDGLETELNVFWIMMMRHDSSEHKII